MYKHSYKEGFPSNLADWDLPLWLLGHAVVQVDHHLKHALGQLSCTLLLLDWNVVHNVVVFKLAHWSHNGGSACSKCLVHAVFLDSLNHFLHLERTH